MTNAPEHASIDRRRQGFALLITITLVAFLVLILVALASLTRVETQVATNSQSVSQARQNALMALNIAIGQLQRHTGPDQRVTATADLQPLAKAATTDPVSGQSLNSTSASTVLAGVDTYWRNSRNRRWVGVWKDPDPARTSLNPEEPDKSVPTPKLLSWLVSGNEQTDPAFLPESQISNFNLAGVTSASAPTSTFGTTAAPYRMLVGPGTVDIVNANDIDRAVVAPEIAIKSDNIPGVSGQPTVGHYAWWVGDENVKARANLSDPYYSLSASADDNRTRLQSAQRPAIEVITSNGTEGLARLDPFSSANASSQTRLDTFKAQLSSALAARQLAYLSSASTFPDELKARYHDFSVHSRGVLSDTRHGGLKADLSWMLGQTSGTVYQTKLRELLGNSSLLTTDSILSNSSTPYVSAPGTNSFTGDFALGLSRSATWDQLRSFFNMGNLPTAPVPGVINASGKAEARLQETNVQGIGPILAQAKVFFGLAIDSSGNISVQFRPLVVLANPYDITLTGDYWVRFAGPAVTVRVNKFDAANPLPSTPDTTSFPATGALAVTYGSRLNLVIKGSEIPPGEARVYCLKQSYNDSGSGALQQVQMAEGYDPGPIFTLALNKSLGTNTHAVLFASKIAPSARLYGADPVTNTGVDDNLVQYILPYELKAPGAVNSNIFLVYPTASGETLTGGGGWFVLTDSLTNPARTSQQANFVQFNPRNLATAFTGNSSDTHPLENAQTYLRDGASGNDAWFTADLMFDNNTGDSVRWGPVAKADYNNPLAGSPPAGVAADTGYVNTLYTTPRGSQPLTSVPQLQHFSATGFISNGRFDAPPGKAEQYATQANTFQVNYPIGNSYPNPRVPRDRAYFASTSSSGSTNMGTAYDASWLSNEVLADRFFFSSFPASGAFDFTTDRLINHNVRPFRSPSETQWDEPANFRGDLRTAASNLIVDGAFNINSTSVEAWKAILSSLRKVPVSGDSSVNVPFARGLYQPKGYIGARTGNTADAWAGFHNLSDTEITSLAEALVLQIRRRGPFLSMADFMNRRLVAKTDDPMNTGLSGAVQSAIDSILNQKSDVSSAFQVQSQTANFADTAYLLPTMTAGASGYILQADLLAPLAPVLTARSDTFVVRTYGDVQNPATGDVTARAWCEAVVQRTPDYTDSTANAATDIPATGSNNETFGRRYKVVSFRWLSPEEI